VTGLRRMARRFGGPGAASGLWLEPACGTGRYLVAAAGRGIGTVGFDSSPAMAAYACRRLAEVRERRPELPRARIFAADMTDFADRLGRLRVDFAFNLINTIRHLEHDAALMRHMAEVARVLKPGGVYAVGLSTTVYGQEFPSEDVWEARRGRTHVKQVAQYLPPVRGRFEMVYSHLVVTRGCEEEHRDSAYRLRCYSLGQWERVVRRSGMEVAAVVDEWGDEIERPQLGYGIWILRPQLTRS
jgi:SAM-dependent methyltransferase